LTHKRKPDERVSLSAAEQKLRIRTLLPVTLDYEPFESPATMKKFLRDLTVLVLAAKIHHRAASACRQLLRTWIEVDLHEKVPELEERIKVLEEATGAKPN
jgi:hypothetical protein